MEFVSGGEELCGALGCIMRVLDDVPPKSELFLVRLQVEEGSANLLAADENGTVLSLRVQNVNNGEDAEDGVVFLPPSHLDLFLRTVGAESIKVREMEDRTVFETHDSSLSLRSLNLPSTFPGIPNSLSGAVELELNSKILRDMILRVVSASSMEDDEEEEASLALQGVLFVIGKDGSLELVASDGSYLARARRNAVLPKGEERRFIIPSAIAHQLVSLSEYTCGNSFMQLFVSKERLVVENSEFILTCPLIQQPFPDYREVISSTLSAEGGEEVCLPVTQMKDALRRIQPLWGSFFIDKVDCRFNKGSLTIAVALPDGGASEIRIAPVEYEGEEFCISFNRRHLENTFSAIEEDLVIARFLDERAPCAITVVGLTNEDRSYTYILSPVVLEDTSEASRE